MGINIRTGPALGAGGFFGVIAIVAAQCSPPPSDATSTSVPFGTDPMPISVPYAVPEPPEPTGPIGTASTTTFPATTPAPSADASTVPAPTSAAIVSTTTTTPAATATAATTTAAPAPPPTEPPVVSVEPPPPPSEPTTTSTSTTTTTSVPTDTVSAAVALANEQRAVAGIPPLTERAELAEAARTHAIDQATMQRLTHTGSDGSSPGDRIARTGFAASVWGENVAAGPPDPTSVIGGWMESPEHGDAILSAAYKSVGVASARAGDGTLYWTMVLAG